MADSTDYVKFMTEKLVNYLETPKEQRKLTRTSAKAAREHWLTRWFGWGPMSFMLWWKSRGHR